MVWVYYIYTSDVTEYEYEHISQSGQIMKKYSNIHLFIIFKTACQKGAESLELEY